jgi:hypothetical protein
MQRPSYVGHANALRPNAGEIISLKIEVADNYEAFASRIKSLYALGFTAAYPADRYGVDVPVPHLGYKLHLQEDPEDGFLIELPITKLREASEDTRKKYFSSDKGRMNFPKEISTQ